jgi:hypothetical protein
MPSPIVVTCSTSSGSLDIVLSPKHVVIVERFFRGMTISSPMSHL